MNMRARIILPALILSAAASPAAAQTFNASVGASLSSYSSGFALHAGLTARNVTVLAGYGLDARLSADLGRGTTLNLDGLLNYPTTTLTFYGGPGLALGFGGASGFSVAPTLTAGVDLPLNGQLGLYAEGVYRFPGSVGARAGLTYAF
ncbi:hypothetical protein [Deinococcus sonorensis]|uniref:Outer membrane protein beta-barrel domain-containing protein n=2 Tax=Deinococcus sonorensis TaxID=309891 RepID=A0AAU7U854_9DEIO